MAIYSKTGKMLYPVCSWAKNQHKLFAIRDDILNRIDDGKADYSEFAKIEKTLDAFNRHVIENTVYADYETGILIKEYIGAHYLSENREVYKTYPICFKNRIKTIDG